MPSGRVSLHLEKVLPLAPAANVWERMTAEKGGRGALKGAFDAPHHPAPCWEMKDPAGELGRMRQRERMELPKVTP